MQENTATVRGLKSLEVVKWPLLQMTHISKLQVYLKLLVS